jgi:hypothetical protein
MSIGFSKNVAFGLMAATSGRASGKGVCELTLSVMSARGVAFRGVGMGRGDDGNGDAFGVSNCVFSDGSFSGYSGSGAGVGSVIVGASDTVEAIDSRVFLFARTLCRPAFLRGDGFFVGDGGGSDAGGLNICDGSTDSLIRVRRLVDLGGAGVKSSSPLIARLASSSSDSSTIFLREAAARRDGREGDTADIVGGGGGVSGRDVVGDVDVCDLYGRVNKAKDRK